MPFGTPVRYLLFDPDIYDFPDKHRIERFRIPVGTFRRIDNRTGRQRLLHQFAAFYHHPRLTESFGADGVVTGVSPVALTLSVSLPEVVPQICNASR